MFSISFNYIIVFLFIWIISDYIYLYFVFYIDIIHYKTIMLTMIIIRLSIR